MTIDVRCSVCKNPDRRRVVELAWNGGMGAETISRVVPGVTGAAILKHLKQHSDGDGNIRAVDVAPVKTARERVLALQEMQLNEVERRIELAKQRAAELNAVIDKHRESGVEGADEIPYHDWSEFTDILGKDMQSAISSILKAQGLTDKREKATADLKLGLFEAMTRGGGLAPKSLIGGVIPPQLTEGEVAEDD